MPRASGLQHSAETACSMYLLLVVVFGHDHKFICVSVCVCVCDWWEGYKLRHSSLFSTQSRPTSFSTPARKQSVWLQFRRIPTFAEFPHLHTTARPDNALMNQRHLNSDLGWTGFCVASPYVLREGSQCVPCYVLQNTVATCINAANTASDWSYFRRFEVGFKAEQSPTQAAGKGEGKIFCYRPEQALGDPEG
jgi:hypothetical protein